jgi:putative oxidoreductase
MERVLGRFAPQFYALLRIVAGFMFACHGAQKVLGLLGGKQQPMFTMPWTAGMIELVCGLLILVGLLTSFAAFIASGEMAVAYFMAHQGTGMLPIQNRGELAALYAFVFLYIASRGAGPWGVDKSTRR